MNKQKIANLIMSPTIKIIIAVLMLNITLVILLTSSQAYSEMKSKAQDFVIQMSMTWDYIQENQDLINYSDTGEYSYKGFHCAIVGLEIADRITTETGYKLRYVTEDARSNMNIANLNEQNALADFRADESLSEYVIWDIGNLALLYIEPVYIEESCLECHGEPAGEIDVSGYAKEGYELGEIYGAVSVSIPFMPYLTSVLQNVVLEVLIFLLLVGLIIYIVFKIISHYITTPLANLESEVSKIQDGDFKINLTDIYAQGELGVLAKQITSMANQLDTLYTDLEGQVKLQTDELEKAYYSIKELNECLEQDNNYKSEFLALMSHELKTPLSAILAFTEILQSRYEFADENINLILNDITTQSQSLSKLINNILDMSKIEAGRYELVPSLVDCVDICSYIEATFMPITELKGVNFTVEVAENLPLIIADWEKLKQMIENLISNAVKFTAPDGNVSLKVKLDDSGKNIKIQVSDDGIGINNEDWENIFEKFYQVDSSNIRAKNGSGLGLSLVKQIVQMHNGTITVKSVPDVSTTFIVTIPSNQKENEV